MSKLTPEQVKTLWIDKVGDSWGIGTRKFAFARAIEALVSQEYEARIAELEMAVEVKNNSLHKLRVRCGIDNEDGSPNLANAVRVQSPAQVAQEEIELLPCSCRGKLSDVVLSEREENDKYYVICCNCGKEGHDENSQLAAAAQWNEVGRKKAKS